MSTQVLRSILVFNHFQVLTQSKHGALVLMVLRKELLLTMLKVLVLPSGELSFKLLLMDAQLLFHFKRMLGV
jgi:hypothetical protein